MHRISGPRVAAVRPTPLAPVSEPGFFWGGDLARGQKGTQVTADWLNDVQENICQVIDAAGIRLEAGRGDQLLAAIMWLITSMDSGFDIYNLSNTQIIALAKALRVPVWLEKDTDFYVNGATGSDQNDGSGPEPEKAFKTAQFAANYVSENYNMGTYTAAIHLAAGTYTEDLTLPKYAASTGRIILTGPASDNRAVVKGAVYTESGAGLWQLKNAKIQYDGRPSPGSPLYFAVRLSQGSRVDLINTTVDCGSSGAHTRFGASSGSGSVVVYDACSFTGQGVQSFLSAAGGGTVLIFNDVTVNGTVNAGTVQAYSCGSLSLDSSLLGRVPKVTGTVTGNRAQAYANGVINSGGSGGATAFPGTAAPAPTTGGQIF